MAIARVTSASGFQNGVDADYNLSYTIASGSDRMLVVGVSLDTGYPFVSTVFNTTESLTNDREDKRPANSSYTSIWHRVAPSVTTADIVATKTGSTDLISIAAANYTGCKQTSVPDATAGASSDSASSASYTITTTVDDCWIVTSEYDNIGSVIDGTNFVQRTSPTNGIYLADSNGSVGAGGSKTVAFSWGSSGPYRASSLALAPAVAAGPVEYGTQVKQAVMRAAFI